MKGSKIKFRSLTLISILLVGAMIGSAVLGSISAQAATAPVVPVGDGTSVSVAYTIYKDTGGYTCAKNSATSAIDFRDTNSRTVIQKALDKTTGGYIWIKSGTYDISTTIYTNKVSIVGDGNTTILKAGSGLKSAVIMVTNGYYKTDYSYVSDRPTGMTIASLQIDGNRNVRTSGTMEGVGLINTLNSRILRVYVHDVIAGQGLYMSNSQYCSITDCQVYNVGDNTVANYGSGIAFGEASSTKVASSHITIDSVYIAKTSMSSIDLEPANNVVISNCVFRVASSYRGYNNPVITEYNKAGYAANDYITVSNCDVNGGFNEFIVLTPSSHSVVKNNVVTYTAGSCTVIYSTNSAYNIITGNVIKTSASRPINLVSCTSCTVSGNTILPR
jgi:hypothetical protein